MMGRQEVQEALFYRFRIEDHVPTDHLLRRIDWLLDFGAIRHELEVLYSHTGRPSVNPELMIRFLLLGYLYGECVRRYQVSPFQQGPLARSRSKAGPAAIVKDPPRRPGARRRASPPHQRPEPCARSAHATTGSIWPCAENRSGFETMAVLYLHLWLKIFAIKPTGQPDRCAKCGIRSGAVKSLNCSPEIGGR